MYFSYDIDNLNDADIEKLTALRGVTSRMSHAYGERNRGRIVSFDGLLYESEDAVIAALPKGYAVKDSVFKSSTGTLYKIPVTEDAALPVTEEMKVKRVLDRLKEDGEKEALSLLSDMTELGIIEKADTILPLMKKILNQARKHDYMTLNVLDIYKTIPKLRVMYWDNKDKRNSLQHTFDLLATKTITTDNIKNPFDRLYLQGLLDFLGLL